MSRPLVHPLDAKVGQRIRYRERGRKVRVSEGRIRAITGKGAIVRTGHTSAGTELLALVTLDQIEGVWISQPGATARRLVKVGRELRADRRRSMRGRITAGNDLTGFPPLAG